MTDKSKWFVYKLNDGTRFGCFRIKPYSNSACAAALKDLAARKNVSGMSEVELAQEYMKIIAKHVIQDWENIELRIKGDESAHETLYTYENAYSMLLMGSIGAELTAWVVEKAKNIN